MELSPEARTEAADAVTALLDGGTLTIGTADSEVLAVLTFGDPAFRPAVGGVASAWPIAPVEAAAAGTAAVYALATSGNAQVATGAVSVAGGGGDLELSVTELTAGVTVNVTSLTYTA